MTDTNIEISAMTDDERILASAEAENESKNADLKQHADKLIQGFAEIDANAPNRAIWELVQNACDLTSNCVVTIDYSNGGFSFTHNGAPFTSTTLIYLIKQVSSKFDSDDVGRFGTGFITTHAFGRKFRIDSLLKVREKLIKISNFLIDRSPMEWKEMVNNLMTQEQDVYKVIKTGETVSTSDFKTTFTYLPETDIEKACIRDSETSVYEYIPFVMTLNEKLKQVTVIDKDGTGHVYTKVKKEPKESFYITTIETHGDMIDIYSLVNNTEDIEIILPIKKGNEVNAFGPSIARLFLYYPLIGTEKWGCNFIIHSKKFAPTESRDGIHLNSKNEQVKSNEDENQKIVAEASGMIFSFIKDNATELNSPIHLAKADFITNSDKPLLNEYFLKLKTLWVNNLKECPVVECTNGRVKPSSAAFLSADLIDDVKYADNNYNLTAKFWTNLPKLEVYKAWTQIINEWNISAITHVSLAELIAKISGAGSLADLESHEDDLKKFYEFLISKGHSGLFNAHKLLPNIKGEFRQLNGLNRDINLPPVLIEIANVIMPDVPKRHIHPEFVFSLELAPYTRKNYAADINAIVSKINDTETPAVPANTFMQTLIRYCKISFNAESNTVPHNVVRLICKFYEIPDALIVIENVKDDELDIRTPQRKLLRLFLNNIAQQDAAWVRENISFLKNLIAYAGYNDYEDYFKTSRVVPNQLDELSIHTSLKIDGNIPNEIKDLYDKVVKPKFPVRSSLLHHEFEGFFEDKDPKTTKSLTSEIESIFTSGDNSNINDHAFKEDILEVIKRSTGDAAWEDYFPVITGKKADIILGTVTDKNIKNDVFSIVTLKPAKINLLGELARNENLEKIIELGKKELVIEQQQQADFQYKRQIGIHLELVLRNRLANIIPVDISAEVKNEQDGQDIIIKVGGKDAYFIEVKSRWNINSSIRMSKNQTIQSNAHKENYALCSIDMVNYAGPDRPKVESIQTIKELIRFNTHIGDDVVHLISILKQTDDWNTIHLDGDIRTLIPQEYIETGIRLEAFESHLVNYLSANFIQNN